MLPPHAGPPHPDPAAEAPVDQAGFATTREPPHTVLVAEALAQAAGFALSCSREVGQLLRILAAARPDARIGETGTGFGVGTAWLRSGMGATARLSTVERDPDRAAAAASLFHRDPRVRVLAGDRDLLAAHGPFDLLFCDEPGKDDREWVIGQLAPGGLLVLDDFTPSWEQPPTFQGRPDLLRIGYLGDERLTAVTLTLSPTMAVILAVRA